jgi:hypothetical protein
MVRKILVMFLLWCGIVLPGCAERYVSQQNTGELIGLAGERGQADRVRMGVLEELEDRSLDGDQQGNLGLTLAVIVRSPLHSLIIRERVVDIIAEKYPAEAPVWLSEALIETWEPAIRRQILEHLERLGDSRSLPGLIVALSEIEFDTNMPTLREGMASDDKNMPKLLVGMPPDDISRVIVKIADDALANVLESYLLGNGEDTLRVRNAALISLVNVNSRANVKGMIMGGGEGDAYLEPLRFWAEHFAYVPGTKSEILMCQMQWLRLSGRQKKDLEQQVRSLKEREGYRFAIADSHVLLASEPILGTGTRDDLKTAIGKRLDALEHTKRPASYRGAADDTREDFSGQCKSLRYTDLLRIQLLLENLKQEENRGALRQILQQDLGDVETEVGGLCFIKEGNVDFTGYPPIQRLGDNQYHESPAMIADGVLCLARWHCHADPHAIQTNQAEESVSGFAITSDPAVYRGRWKGGALAGPGVDDIAYGKYFNCPQVIVSYMDRDSFNVDYVTASGIVIDLGNY